MKIAVMQPYIFPYIGYFQLINSVDKFVIFDDVNYIKKGWINRNNILVNGKPHLFNIPLTNSSQNRHINKHFISSDVKWKEKLLKTIKEAYSKAPYFSEVYSIVESVINSDILNLSIFLKKGITEVLNYLDVNTSIVDSSGEFNNQHLKGENRIIDICKQMNAEEYVNPIGGVSLYNRDNFSKEEIKLSFLKTDEIKYKQLGSGFFPNLSIIDVLMYNGRAGSKGYLINYSLI